MNFIRPEARRAIWQWREVLVAIAVLVVGAYWAISTGELLRWLGYVVLAVGIFLLLSGVQRGRFRGNQGGPGVVQVDEGAVAYFGPLNGGVVALREMNSLTLDPTGTPAHWVLSQAGQADLYIPLNAAGAEALFDAFASLPGIRTEFMLAEMGRSSARPIIIWERVPDLSKLH
ncbi:hypothetical protein [Roseovarius aestuarii]|uniref:Uncharacterized protein n=1 Tax=Roseovarius aestuarii TaxID=475083 RepID=A0A1X7BT75_9RHOB|nr:hypothetical protein [Roseovarius aestuarii]SMC12808.1 hypothetical protein ROA7745_02640 [Roseovarius aestuarii]